MITEEGKLRVFEDFRIDHSLPKYQKEEGEANTIVTHIRNAMNVVSLDDYSDSNRLTLRMKEPDDVPQKKSVWKKLAFWDRPKKEEPPRFTVEEFFSHIKNSTEELAIIKERAAGYERAIVNARRSGQVALVEQLKTGLHAYAMESQLVAINLKRFIPEETIVRFAKETKRGLRLDWVKNFTRQIPEDVTATKTRCDELGIFDNYVVLHYDPDSKAVADTEAEKEAKKDPILFGLIKGKRVLYFIGDWIDEFCDLTLDQFAEVMGREAIHSLDSLPDPYREAP